MHMTPASPSLHVLVIVMLHSARRVAVGAQAMALAYCLGVGLPGKELRT